MYHHISVPPPDADAIRRDISVSPQNFEAQLRYLRDEGYTTIHLSDLLYYLAQGQPLPKKPIVLTFDDGYRDNYDNAFFLLHKYDMVGTFFLITDFIDQERADYMTWPQVRVMVRCGMELGSHSRDHPELSGRSTDFLVWQVLGSREMIESRVGITPRFFSYPSGQYDDQTIRVVHSANFWGGVTTHQGTTQRSDRVFELMRVRIRGSYTVDDLARLLSLDW